MSFNNITSPIKQRRKPTVNVDWVDLASATGYVSYDFYSVKDTTGVSRLLIESSSKGELTSITTYTGNPITTYALVNTDIDQTTYTKAMDLDWDTTAMQLPRTIRGTAYISFNAHIHLTSGANPLWYMVVRIRKWDGASETEIANAQTEAYTRTANQDLLHNLAITVPKTLIKKGEQLRITIEGWGKTASGASVLTISGDPANLEQSDGTRTMAAGNTRIVAQIPFEIDQ